MTLQEAKEQIAKEKGYSDSLELIEAMTGMMSKQFAERAVLTEAAELYAKAQYDKGVKDSARMADFWADSIDESIISMKIKSLSRSILKLSHDTNTA